MYAVEELKRNWRDDPCWDIEDTEGFEEYKEELISFRLQCEERWTALRNATVQAKANELQCSPELAEYILRLEERLAA